MYGGSLGELFELDNSSLLPLLSHLLLLFLLFACLQKVKELTYMHSEGIMAGELKHGPLALVDDSMPVIMIVMRDPVYVVKRNKFDPLLIEESI